MHWRTPIASALVGLGLAAGGCDSEDSFHDNLLLRADPTLLRTIEAAGRGEETEARAQAPDSEQPIVLTSRQAPPLTSPEVQQVGFTAVQVCAVVNGEAILHEELRAATYQVLRSLDALAEPERSTRQNEVLTQALNTLIEREVVLQDAMERLNRGGGKNLDKIKEIANKEFEKTWMRPIKEQFKIKSDEDFKAFLRSQGVSLAMAKRQWERQFMAQQYLQNRVYPYLDKIGHVQIVEYYEAHPEEFKVEDHVEWQGLFIAAARHASRDAARRFAEVLAQRVRQGEDFVKLSEQFDDGDGKLRKGAGIGNKPGEIKPAEAEPVLFKLRDGDMAILEQSSGFHVIRMVKRQHAGVMPFDEKTQKLIKDKLRSEIMQKETKRIVIELKRKAVIEVYK